MGVPQKLTHSDIHIDLMQPVDWPHVSSIYIDGIATGNATLETLSPTWEEWDRFHLPFGRMVAREGRTIAGWAALSRVSQRMVYAGVAELSVYVAGWARGKRVGSALMDIAIETSERSGIWTLQGSIFPENVASLKMVEAAGFRQVGRRERIGKLMGQWRDVILVERRSQVVGVE
jgi:L-amino acid N-acyltransferase YncA